LFKGTTARSVLNKIKSAEKKYKLKYGILQEFISNPALAKYPSSSSKGFKVQMRIPLVLTCSKTKREWTMLRAGAQLRYALNHYKKYANVSSRSSFLSAVDTDYSLNDLVMKGRIKDTSAHRWPATGIAYLENLKKQGWTTSVEKEWKKIEGIFSKAAKVYAGTICNQKDKAVSDTVDRLFDLISADVLIAGITGASGAKYLRPYLMAWKPYIGALDNGDSRNLENLQITEMAALYKGGVVKRPWWMPLFQQKEYRHIGPDNFKTKVYKNVWTKTSSWGR
jgi:hypothetical protein